MKTKWTNLGSLAVVVMALSFFMVSCDKDDMRGKGNPFANAYEEAIITLGENNECGPDEVKLIAGQHYEVGKVTMEIDGDYLVVTYEITEPGWCITETHLHVAEFKELIPTNPSGNPVPGQFDYKGEHDDCEPVTYQIKLQDGWTEGTTLYIAAHAVVVGEMTDGDADLDAFNEKFNDGIELEGVEIKFPGQTTYFGPVTIANSGTFLDGEYDGWCVEAGILYQRSGDPTAYSSYGLPNYDMVNWLINYVDFGDDDNEYTKGEVQWAIWKLLEQPDPTAPWALEPYNMDNIDYLVGKAEEYGVDFKPGCGDVIAVLLVYEIDEDTGRGQDIIIEYPLVCYQEETAWGEGTRFVPRGNWGMYFTYTICFDNGNGNGECQTETAWGGNTAGDGSAWWYYYDASVGGEQTIWAGQHTEAGTVEVVNGTVYITLTDGWELQVDDEAVKIQGYDEIPSSRPAAGGFDYKGTDLAVYVGDYAFYAIHLDVQLCE